jgi:hypothetical protein
MKDEREHQGDKGEPVKARERGSQSFIIADRHAEADEIFGVHGFDSVENGGRGVRTHRSPISFIRT